MSKTRTGIAPLPHYAMPDASEPPYPRILEQVQEYEHSLIGSSYFYIRAFRDRFDLCRIVYGGGNIFFHELVDYENHGISDDDMEVSVREDLEFSTLPGFYPISPVIEQKLRILYEQ
jgi:hypothetical protein